MAVRISKRQLELFERNGAQEMPANRARKPVERREPADTGYSNYDGRLARAASLGWVCISSVDAREYVYTHGDGHVLRGSYNEVTAAAAGYVNYVTGIRAAARISTECNSVTGGPTVNSPLSKPPASAQIGAIARKKAHLNATKAARKRTKRVPV